MSRMEDSKNDKQSRTLAPNLFCRSCASPLVQATGWEQEEESLWGVRLWCPECGLKKRRQERGVLEIDDLKNFASEQGFNLVQNGRIPPGRTDFWTCNAGHLWEVSRKYATSVSWCPECGRPGKATGEGRHITEEQVKIKV